MAGLAISSTGRDAKYCATLLRLTVLPSGVFFHLLRLLMPQSPSIVLSRRQSGGYEPSSGLRVMVEWVGLSAG